MDMALTAYLQFGSNVTRRYFKEYMVSDCHIVHKRKYNRFCPEGNADGMVCEGYVVGIEEQFSTTRLTTAGDTQHLSPADKPIKELDETWTGKREQLHDDKLKEIEEAYAKYQQDQIAAEQKRREEEMARGNRGQSLDMKQLQEEQE